MKVGTILCWLQKTFATEHAWPMMLMLQHSIIVPLAGQQAIAKLISLKLVKFRKFVNLYLQKFPSLMQWIVTILNKKDILSS